MSDTQLWKGAILPAMIVATLSLIVDTILKGMPGFLGGLLASITVIIFFSVHLLVARISRNLDPMATMMLAMFSYFAKLFALGALLWAIAKYTDRATINRTAFGITAVALTIAWLWGEIASYMKLRLHLPLPETK